ncbi:DsbA family protein [Agrococcus sediminis]|uniref:DsbA family protein n=1 Tax=Agrococcus sediminis TaxID=2599924 RepID=UPI00341A123A
MQRRTAIAVVIVLAALAVILSTMLLVTRPWESAGAAPASETGTPTDASAAAAPPALINDTTHILDDAGADAPVVVEFLDFECEACGQVFPTMEALREQYAGEVTFAIRYFPLPGHYNSGNAAVAVEAAAQQGQFEAMYQRMFAPQAEWGEGQTSEASRFRGFAEELGLDMAAYDAAIADPATLQRVEDDFQAGMALGVSSTPGIFIDGQPLELTRLSDIETAIQSALDGE